MQIICVDKIDQTILGDWKRPILVEDQTAFFQYTSGSTSDPKGVQITHRNILHNCLVMEKEYRSNYYSKGVNWLPPFHDMGLVGVILHPLFTGFPSALMSWVSVIEKPVLWLKEIEKCKATIVCSPNFMFDYCVEKIKPEEKEGLDLSSLEIMINGGEPIRKETMKRFYEAIRENGLRSDVFYPSYGMAESTLFIAAKQWKNISLECYPETDEIDWVSYGASYPEQIVQIVDPETCKRLQEEKIGEIWVSSPSVAKGYWKQDDLNHEIFGAQLKNFPDVNFLRTGDLGFVKNNELYVTGRLKDLIIYRGRNIYPQDLELVVETAHSALRKGFSAAFSIDTNEQEEIVIVQELRFGFRSLEPEEIFSAILEGINEFFHFIPTTILLTKPGSVLKTSSGKIRRNACREKYRAKEFPIVFQWHDS